ncbi:hypothetical protein ABL78_5444 [Leptomonas seymouri]|uniref:Uncharacterized protein n=1 Tax=Leptomonas seymouri TaxID=5684 RepID=A0A0N1IJU2_LEPSE|nr:hypothetical protein ABL78_5444 [Leptomonas seymouri]|eukprot:KPI85484.1 hypothetical protein ABL78_5444 [Leptomonas seymouri]
MGIGSSKPEVASPPVPSTSPVLSPEAVERMCTEAYTAGISDADVHHMAQREALMRQGAELVVVACLMSAWLAYLYGRASGIRFAEEVAAPRFDAQKQLLDRVSGDLVSTVEENKSLVSAQQEQLAIIARQRNELRRAALQRKAMLQSVQLLRRRNASVRKQLRGLTSSLHAIQRQMYAGMVGAGVIALVVVWRTCPQRQGSCQRVVTPPLEERESPK